jgi:hypothetical protein
MNDAMNAVNGPATWLTLGLFLVGALILAALLIASARIVHRYPTERRQIPCPASGKVAEVSAIYDLKATRWINVAACNQAGFPQCDRECLLGPAGKQERCP